MKKTLFRRVICFILSLATLLGTLGITAAASSETYHGSNRDTASSLEEMQALVGVSSYDEYKQIYGDPDDPNVSVSGLPVIKIDVINDIIAASSNAVVVSASEQCLESMISDQSNWATFGEENLNTAVYLPATGSTSWSFDIPENASSYYYIKLEYYNPITGESSISSIERKLLIDGKPAYNEASNITLTKFWEYTNYTVSDPVPAPAGAVDGTTVRYDYKNEEGYYHKIVETVKDGMLTTTTYTITSDINGNSMAPAFEEISQWNTYYVQDSTGYHQNYLNFFFAYGSHQLTLAAEREPVIIKSIELIPYEPDASLIKSYEEVKAEYIANGYQSASGALENVVLQGEFPNLVSDSSVYPTNDNSSSANFPSTPSAQLYNVIGENSYDTMGQWAAYTFTVNESGLYKIGARYLQSQLQGMYICRALKLTGGHYGETPTVPFVEAYDIQFNYSKEWQSEFLSDSNGTVFELYFEKGVEYTLYLECSLGSLSKLIQRVENSLTSINGSYLEMLQLTGSSPDEYRDYDFWGLMQDDVINLLVQAVELMNVKEALEKLCGTSGAHLATLETVAILLDKMGSDRGEKIAVNMSTLKSYLGTLGTWINDSKKGTLVLDSISICPAQADAKTLPKKDVNFFKSLWFEFTSFIYSFFIDYEAMGLTEASAGSGETVDVWLATGRDQSNIWRSLVDASNGFTNKTGYGVNLKLVTSATLLPSILAGKGPDVYMGLGAADVINFAIRDAVIGVSGNSPRLTDEQNAVFKNTYYTYKDENGKATTPSLVPDASKEPSFVSLPFHDNFDSNYVQAAKDTVTLLDVSYGIPQTMSFAMMFYRMDVLANLGQEVPETWSQLLAILPLLQSNNMTIGVNYTAALQFMIYQKGGNMWRYTDDPEYAGARIDLDSDIALESFDYVCRLYTDYSFPVSYDGANRFRTGEMPIIISDYISMYNTLTVYATEIEGLWEFCPLPGSEREDGTINYNSIAGITATVMLNGCNEIGEMTAAWEFMQWQTSADVQSNYGNRMVALIGPSAKYESANVNAIRNLSWTANEREALEDQMKHMSSIVNYPGSYIIDRYMKFAFLDVVNDSVDPVDAMTDYIEAINEELKRKREEFGMKVFETEQDAEDYEAGREKNK